MNEFSKIFKKVNGFSVIKNYIKARVLSVAILQALILGTSRKALEILRLATQLKIQLKLKKKYDYVLKECEKKQYDTLDKKRSNKVWICWLQGIDNAPVLVQRCFESLNKNLKDKDIILITLENYKQYVDFPEHIIEKWNKGIITNTHFSDLLRLELLINYGGTWIDATVLCTGENIPSYILDSDLFFYQVLKPGRDGHALTISSWLITSCTNNKVLLLTRELLYEYWKKEKFMKDYFLLHMFMSIVLERYPEEYNKVFKMCNSIPHILLLQIYESYDYKKYEQIKQMTPLHKLSYKGNKDDMEKKGTFFDVIINKKNI